MYSGITFICILKDLKTLCIYKRSYTIPPNDLSTVYRHKISFPKYLRAFQGRVYDRLVEKSGPNLVKSVLVDNSSISHACNIKSALFNVFLSQGHSLFSRRTHSTKVAAGSEMIVNFQIHILCVFKDSQTSVCVHK